MRLRLPERADRLPVLAAGCVWLGVAAEPRAVVVPVVVAMIAAAAASPLRRVAVFVALVGVLVGTMSGALVSLRADATADHGVEAGPVAFSAEALTDPVAGRHGTSLVVDPGEVARGRLPDLPIALRNWPDLEAEVGASFSIRGTFSPQSFRLARHDVAGAVSIDSVEVLPGEPPVHVRVANALRSRIQSQVAPSRADGRALVAGFLIGDTSALSAVAADWMRSAGLSHFVAVSGSNVALFLGLWWILLAPLRVRSWTRAAFGIVGLLVFATLTRWEPSVVRAAACAGVLLVGRAAGLPLSAWSTIGVAVCGILLVSGEMAGDVGFQLSVLATIGVLLGSGAWRFRPAWAANGLGASVGAQLAVSPVLVYAFGSLPLLAPVANLIAAPLVAASTALGGIGALVGWDVAVDAAAAFASAVLSIARVASPWPQIGAVELVSVLAGGIVVWRFARPAAVPVLLLATALTVWPWTARPGDLPAAMFLDVGQGDAALLMSEDATVLVDGGPDPAVLARKLVRYGVDRVDLLVVTHAHADHITGLEAVLGRMPVGAVAYHFGEHSTSASEWLEREIAALGLSAVDPAPGAHIAWPGLRIRFLGPVRRYESPNDESVVFVADLGNLRILMSGDIETYAQAELEIPGVDVLKVPHQGAATSDLAWLRRHAGHRSVISVGANDFGHPSDEVVEALEAAGSIVKRTDVDGDVVVIGPSGP